MDDKEEKLKKRREIQKRYRDNNKEKVRASNKKYRDNNKEKINASAREYRRKNIEKVRSYNYQYVKQWKLLNPDKVKASRMREKEAISKTPEILKQRKQDYYKRHREEILLKQKLANAGNERRSLNSRKQRLKIEFGLSLSDYEDLHESQNGVCAICSQPETAMYYGGKSKLVASRVKQLAVDHDHATGAVRGLLCYRCNRAVGLFRDDIQLVMRALEYLSRTSGGVLIPDGVKVSQETRNRILRNVGENWAYNIKKKYNITVDQYLGLYQLQNSGCGICNVPTSNHKNKSEGVLVVDHNHSSGTVRGLLCRLCNLGLAFFDDEILKLEKCLEYLRRYRKQQNEVEDRAESL
jgi:hypothetical protein